MNCAELEELICDYADGTLTAARKAEVERHLEACPACAELARDSAAAVAFMERAADVEPPPELITRILFDAPWARKAPAKDRGWLAKLCAPLVQPRFVMGMAMTILSFSILSRFVPMQQLKAADLRPSEVWASLDDRAQRAGEVLLIAVQVGEDFAVGAPPAPVYGIIHALILLEVSPPPTVLREPFLGAVVGLGVLHDVLDLHPGLVRH